MTKIGLYKSDKLLDANKIKAEIEQNNKDVLAVSLGLLLGAPVVSKTDYEKLNKEKQALLNRTKDFDKVKLKLAYTECKLQAFVNYHKQWKPITKKLQKRLTQLYNEEVYIDFSHYPKDISDNLKEAYNCYIQGFNMACYIMVLRTIEIAVTEIYNQSNPPKIDSKGKTEFIPVIKKLNWVKTEKIIGGADFLVAKGFIEARNDSVHEVYIPSDKQILAAFETVIVLCKKLRLDKK